MNLRPKYAYGFIAGLSLYCDAVYGKVALQITGESITAEQDTATVSEFAMDMAVLTSYSPAEPAGARGISGISGGIGIANYSLAAANSLTSEALGRANDSPSASYAGEKLYLLKGLFYPVDVGLTATHIGSSRSAFVAGGHVQVTLFEEFQLPAVSLRATHSQTFELPNIAAENQSIELISSIGFLRYFTIYGGSGTSWTTVNTKIVNDSTMSSMTAIRLAQDTDSEAASNLRAKINSGFYYGGLSVRFLPPFVTGTIEMRPATQQREVITAKLAIGI